MKCAVGFNYHRVKHSIANQKLLPAYCPCCRGNETWDHMIQYRALSDYNKRFVSKVESKSKPQIKSEQQYK